MRIGLVRRQRFFVCNCANPKSFTTVAVEAIEAALAAVFVGALKVSGVKPSGRLSATGMNVRASVTAELSLRLLSTRSGGTVWRGNSAASGTVGRLAVSRGMPAVAVRDRDAAYGEIVSALVAGASRDLRPSWVRQ